MASLKEYKKEKNRAGFEFYLSPRKREIANKMFTILNRDHVGKENRICADALAEKINEELNLVDNGDVMKKPVGGHYVRECVRLFRETGKFPWLQSSIRGYYVDHSIQAFYDSLRFVVAGIAKRVGTVINMCDIMAEKFGEQSIPADLRFWLDSFDEHNDLADDEDEEDEGDEEYD